MPEIAAESDLVISITPFLYFCISSYAIDVTLESGTDEEPIFNCGPEEVTCTEETVPLKGVPSERAPEIVRPIIEEEAITPIS